MEILVAAFAVIGMGVVFLVILRGVFALLEDIYG